MRIDISYNRSLISPGDPGRSHSLTCFDTGESFSELLVIIYGAGEAPFSDTTSLRLSTTSVGSPSSRLHKRKKIKAETLR